jgi:hypothetical protein
MCGYLEDYVEVTAKVQKSQAKDYEKVLKTVSDPLREGHHFSQSAGGVSAWFENIRSNTQVLVPDMCSWGSQLLMDYVGNREWVP